MLSPGWVWIVVYVKSVTCAYVLVCMNWVLVESIWCVSVFNLYAFNGWVVWPGSMLWVQFYSSLILLCCIKWVCTVESFIGNCVLVGPVWVESSLGQQLRLYQVCVSESVRRHCRYVAEWSTRTTPELLYDALLCPSCLVNYPRLPTKVSLR